MEDLNGDLNAITFLGSFLKVDFWNLLPAEADNHGLHSAFVYLTANSLKVFMLLLFESLYILEPTAQKIIYSEQGYQNPRQLKRARSQRVCMLYRWAPGMQAWGRLYRSPPFSSSVKWGQ